MKESWCLAKIDGVEVKVRLDHIGRGRFRIVEDEHDGQYVNKVLDASELIHCKFLPERRQDT
jgi:hypothetical protein